jgi:MFS family permease
MFVGLVLSQLCLNLKLSEMQIGMVNAIPNIVLPVQLVSAYMVLHSTPRKPLFITLGIISRIFMLLIALLLMQSMDGGTKTILFMLCMFGFHISFAMGVPLWFSWMSDIVPEEENTHFFGNRNVIAFISGMSYILLFGWILDEMQDSDMALTLILGLSGVMSLIEMWVYKDIPDGESDKSERPQLNWLFEPFKRFEFVRFISFGIVFNGALFLVMPFFFIYLKQLGFSSLWIQMGMALNAIGTAIGSKFWAVMQKRIKNSGVLRWTGLLKMAVLIVYGCLDAGTSTIFLGVVFLVDGWAMGGWYTASFSILTAEMPKRNSSIVMAWFFSLIGLSAFTTSFLSGVWMDYWPKDAVIVELANRHPFQALCWFSSGMLPLGLILFKGYQSIREP